MQCGLSNMVLHHMLLLLNTAHIIALRKDLEPV